MDMNKRQYSPQEIDQIRDALGTGRLRMDSHGNIIAAHTGMIIVPTQSYAEITIKEREEAQNNRKKELKEYFHNLEKPVKEALMQQALAYKIQKAAEYINNHKDIKKDPDELWAISYEEMAKMLAEGILLDDD